MTEVAHGRLSHDRLTALRIYFDVLDLMTQLGLEAEPATT